MYVYRKRDRKKLPNIIFCFKSIAAPKRDYLFGITTLRAATSKNLKPFKSISKKNKKEPGCTVKNRMKAECECEDDRDIKSYCVVLGTANSKRDRNDLFRESNDQLT